MRFHWGSLPIREEFEPETTGFRPIREPGAWQLQLLATPVAVAQGLAVYFWGEAVGLDWVLELMIDRNILLWWMASLAPMLVAHELLHALVHPGCGRSDDSVLGFWPRRGLFYAHYEGEWSRERMLACLALPWLVMSVVPFVVMSLLGASVMMAGIAGLHALTASGDVVVFGVLLHQVPRGRTIRNKGYFTYFKA